MGIAHSTLCLLMILKVILGYCNMPQTHNYYFERIMWVLYLGKHIEMWNCNKVIRQSTYL